MNDTIPERLARLEQSLLHHRDMHAMHREEARKADEAISARLDRVDSKLGEIVELVAQGRGSIRTIRVIYAGGAAVAGWLASHFGFLRFG